MSLFKLFNLSFEEDARHAYSLMAQGKYKDASSYILQHMPITPHYKWIEAMWIVAECEYKQGEFGLARQTLTTILSSPGEGSHINESKVQLFMDKARQLQRTIEEQERQNNSNIKYPKEPLRDFMEKYNGDKEYLQVFWLGISDRIGDYYIENSIFYPKEKVRFNIYIKPITRTTVEVFCYVPGINEFVQKKDDDMIIDFVLSNKYSTVEKLIKDGKNGSYSDCSLYRTWDYFQPPLKDRPLVLGCRTTVSDSNGVTIEDVESKIEMILQQYQRIASEMYDNPPSSMDTAKIAILAFVKGVSGKLIGNEIWPAIKDSLFKK